MVDKPQRENHWPERLKKRWKLKSAWQVLLVLLTFACTGFSVLFLKQPLYKLAGITDATPVVWRTLYYMVAVLPVYQVLLLAWGFMFGQFSFFWEFEKRMFSRIASFFRK